LGLDLEKSTIHTVCSTLVVIVPDLKFPKHLASLQTNGYTCGPCALRHALLCYGVRRSVRWLARDLEAETEGTNEYAIHATARVLGFRTWHRMTYSAAMAQECVRWHIKRGEPVLCCVDVDRDGPWQHWVCLVGASKRGVTVADSARPGPVVYRQSWKRFMQRLAVWEDGQTNRYDVYALIPR
jgi:hypothetical protein